MASEQEFKESRVRGIALTYYSRKDILDAIYKFSKKREVSPRYYNGFGKRPDSFQYPSDIISLVKRGATSFHCSEEIWEDPLKISTDFSEEDYNEIRDGWDLVIDIDCNWIDYSKKAALAIITALEYRGVKNYGIKFSGSKGFHIIVPWEAFPKFFGDKKTSDMFPEFPRAIVNYLKDLSRPILEELIKDMPNDFANLEGYTGVKCEDCNNLASENFQITIRCPKCHPPHIEIFKTSMKDYKKRKCPTCSSQLEEEKKSSYYFCSHCDKDSLTNSQNFNEKILATDIFKILGLDVLLVSPRHLFRMPYSLHEKTALASIVITKENLDSFTFKDADPLNAKILDFYPEAIEGEATSLLTEAIDFQKTFDRKQENKKIKYDTIKQEQGKERDKNKKYEKIILPEIKESWFPPAIEKILKGMKDGRKRALFILLNFFRSLGMSMEDIEERLKIWNKLNKPPIKQGYITSQLLWHSKHPIVLPPNFDNEVYKAIDVYDMDFLSQKVKNPVNYVIRKALSEMKNSKKEKPKKKIKNKS